MVSYSISPYVSFIENLLFPGLVQHGVCNRLTGEVLEPRESERALLHAAALGTPISLNTENLTSLGADGYQLQQLIEKLFLIPAFSDPLLPFMNHYVARPIQNPALLYRSNRNQYSLARISMACKVYSTKKSELPQIIEEPLPQPIAEILLMADGKTTLKEVFKTLGDKQVAASGVREAIDFLTSVERQLIKLTLQKTDLDDPYKPVNTVPRSFYHSSRWDVESRGDNPVPIIDFHLHGIDDPSWEFDLAEPTLNHCFRFPNEILGGLDYGSRFWLATLPEIVLRQPLVQLEVLEIGGGTGTFAKSFIKQSRLSNATLANKIRLNYHIADLSPILMQSQRRVLADLLPPENHYQLDATELDLPGRKFDLIILNEVVADFPVAKVQRSSPGEGDDMAHRTGEQGWKWEGAGVPYVEKYGLAGQTAPDHFFINVGALRLIERAWDHLSPGGTVIITEYGSTETYPVQSYHLNHEEYSVHFGHLVTCAVKVGFACRLLKLKEFLDMDDEAQVLNGREEHILCLNHILRKYGNSLPFAVISKTGFEQRYLRIAEEIELSGISFSPLKKGFYFAPRVEDFMVLILTRPC